MKLADTGLRKQPFRTQGKPLVLVPYASQKNAIQFLNDTRVNKCGLGLFHGPPLSGKTTIVQRFASSLPGDHATAVVDGARTDPARFLKEILGQYGYDHGFNTASERFNMIRVVALQQAASGQAPVLVIENVHAMSPLLLELLCELAEMSVDESSALRIILSSDKPMLPIVEAPAMQSIESRLTGKFLLKPLTRTETATYAHKKLKSGGCSDPKAVMPPAVCDRLHSASGGWPGVIDRLAMMALAKAEHIPLLVEHIPEKPPTSRQHAILIRNDKSTIIVDLKSRNGIYINGKRVKKHVLINNDIISLGDHRLKFVDPSATERTTLRGAGWDDTTLAESIRDFRKGLLRQLRSTN